MIDLGERILLNDGISIVSDDYAVRKLLESGDIPKHIRVVKSDDSDSFDLMYKTTIGIDDIDDSNIEPEIYCDEDFEELVWYIINKRRDNTSDEEHNKRLSDELGFFTETNNLPLLCSIRELISKFKDDNIVWGVGRGSSCASYVLYLLEVHDINPIKYDISFKEFSKEN